MVTWRQLGRSEQAAGFAFEHRREERTVNLPDDVRVPIQDELERVAQEQGSIDPTTAQTAVAIAWWPWGIHVTPGTSECKRIATRALEALVAQGRLVKASRGQFVATEWNDILEHPDYEVNAQDLVRNRATKKLLKARIDNRGRELVDLGGTTFDTARLHRIHCKGRDVHADERSAHQQLRAEPGTEGRNWRATVYGGSRLEETR